jgi:hypothetical protein
MAKGTVLVATSKYFGVATAPPAKSHSVKSTVEKTLPYAEASPVIDSFAIKFWAGTPVS